MGSIDTTADWEEPPKPLLGVVRKERIVSPEDTAVYCEIWEPTYNIDDLLLPPDQVIFGSSLFDIRKELEERYPIPRDGLVRVFDRWSYRCNQNALTVYSHPVAAVTRFQARAEDTSLLERLIAEHGDILVDESTRNKLIGTSAYTNSALVSRIAVLPGMHLLRVDAKKAEGRRKGQASRLKKENAKRELARNKLEIQRTRDEFRLRLGDTIMPHFKDLFPYSSGMVVCPFELIAAGERLIGKKWYRKAVGFDVFLMTWHGWDRKLAIETLSLTEENVKWLDAEYAAMVRREKKRKREEARK